MSAFVDASGKVAAEAFKSLLMTRCGSYRQEVLTGPAFGVDTAVIDLGEQALVVSSDPLSLIPTLGLRESAWLSVHLMVNDMATSGFAPQYAQFILNLPVSLSEEDFSIYWGYIHEFCSELGIAITGGHTGQIPGQESTIAGGGTMFCVAPKSGVLTSNGAHPGDILVITKEAALSSTAILARAFPQTVQERLGHDVWREAAANFYRTSVLREALLAVEVLRPHQELHAMHDVTEGGVLGAIAELAQASDCGFGIELERIPVSKAVQAVADLFAINPIYSIGAGSMVMAVQPGREHVLLDHLHLNGIPATVVGRLTQPESGCWLDRAGERAPFRFSGQDPYWTAFYQAVESGWR